MDISAGLIAKGTAGALAASAAIGGGVWANEQGLLGDLFGKSAEPTEVALENKVVQEKLEQTEQKVSGVTTEPSGTSDIQGPESSGPSQPPSGAVDGNPSPASSEPETTGSLPSSGASLSEITQNNELTKFDQGLITWLETNGNDIVFGIKYKPNGEAIEKEIKETDSSTNFSSFISSSSDPVKISVVISDSSKNLKGGGDKTSLKALNENKKWTWECRMTFKKDKNSNNVNEVDPDQINRVYGNEEKGLFRKLMKEVASDSNSSEIKELKKKFIKNCAKARTETENKKINEGVASDNREIITPKNKVSFVLKKGESSSGWGAEADKLYFEDKSKFNEWFPDNANQ